MYNSRSSFVVLCFGPISQSLLYYHSILGYIDTLTFLLLSVVEDFFQ